MNFCFRIQVGFFIVTVFCVIFLCRVNEICTRHTVRIQRLLHVDWVYVKCHSTTHRPQPQRTPRSSVDPTPNDITALTLIPQHYPATTTQRCDTLCKGRVNPPPLRPYSQQQTSLENSNCSLTLLEYSMLTSDVVTYLFCM